MATKPRKKTLSELSHEELGELLALVRSADSVEMKVTVPEQGQRQAIISLGLDPLDAQIRQVFFFDTPDLALNRAGVAVRARRIQGRAGDTVVKLRPIVPDALPDDVRHSRSVGVEVDALPGGYVCSASMKGKAENAEIRSALGDASRLRKLFSKEQRAFFSSHAPEGVGWDRLAVLGPIFVLKVKTVPPEFGRRLTAEMWLYPDGSRIFELSTKCPPDEMVEAALESRAFLQGAGLDLSGEQQTKTKTALEFFASELQADAAT